MMRWLIHILTIGLVLLALAALALNGFALLPQKPERITYGVTFATPYARFLGLDTRAAFEAVLTELGVRHLRLAAHWSMIESQRDTYDFSELDYQMRRAREVGADVILGVGRRLPRWPECHTPSWARNLSDADRQREVRELIRAVVERYRDEPHLIYWQVENEPYLEVFAYEHCGDLDEEFLREEVALVRSLDPDTPILMTDSGNLGTWHRPYRLGDALGTSVYRHFWFEDVGQFTSVLPPAWYRAKYGALHTLFPDKPIFLSELSAEPWLTDAITGVPIEVQLERMNPELFRETVRFAKETHLNPQYLWGVEWWWWLKQNGYPQMWELAKEVFAPIYIEEPQEGAIISSPLQIHGEARGYWYFEAVFPVILEDANGEVLAQAPATAQSSWMVHEFVPFALELSFPPPQTKTGRLIFKRDNPSGLPRFDAAVTVPVRFAR